MNIKNECLHCVVRQMVELAERLSDEEKVQRDIIKYGLNLINEVGLDSQPAYITGKIFDYAKKKTGIVDPFDVEKKTFNQVAQKLIESFDLKRKIQVSEAPLETAIRLSIAGNIIDFSLGETIEEHHVRDSIQACLQADLYGNALNHLIEAIEKHNHIMILGDNAGEIVFDQLLIQTMKKKVIYVVKGGPIVNDATRQDAEAIGLDQETYVMDTGISYQGIILDESSPEFIKALEDAPLVIAKGQANYECLNEYNHPNMYFLLRAKCQAVADVIGCQKGAFVCIKN